jgi:prevent-host-death family protein
VTRVTATEAARNFSEILNRVADGEEFEITRNGSPVARLTPAKSRLLSPERFRELMASLPPVDEDFARDLREIRKATEPPTDPWQS